MSVLREKKTHLLVLLVVLSLLVVWQPWRGMTPAVRGLTLAPDTGGGYGILLDFQTSIVNFRTSGDIDEVWDSVEGALAPDWGIRLISKNPAENLIQFEIGGRVTQSYLQTRIGAFGEVENLETGKNVKLGEETLKAMQARLDPHALSGTRVRLAGDNHLFVETTSDPDDIEALLTTSGRLELFVGEQPAVGSTDILEFGKLSETGSLALLPVYFTEDGMAKFNSAVKGKGGEALMIYVDRPSDAVIIFKSDISLELNDLFYDNEENIFRENLTRYPFVVTALPSETDQLSPEILNYLSSHAWEKLRVILLGSKTDFSEAFLEAIPDSYTYEVLERRPDETADEWVMRACGRISSLPISESIAENGLSTGRGINLPFPGGFQSGKVYRNLLQNRLPVQIYGTSVVNLSSRTTADFVNLAVLSCVVGLVITGTMISKKHRRNDFGMALMASGGAVLLLDLAVFMVLGVSVTSVVGVLLTGVFFIALLQLWLVTQEVLVGIEGGQRVKIGWRIPKAVEPVYLSTLLVSAMLIIISAIGVKITIGVAAVVIVLLLLNSFLVAPVHAHALETLSLRSWQSKEQKQRVQE